MMFLLPGKSQNSLDKIFFIGMPGSGKSTLGREVAIEYGLMFLDLDEEIEKREHKTIKEIFEAEGEDYFRQAEKRELEKITLQHPKFLLSTGGGTPCFYDNMTFINAHGLSVFIDVPLDHLIKRLRATDLAQRPKIGSENDLFQQLEITYRERIDIYRKAKKKISGQEISVMDVVTALDLK